MRPGTGSKVAPSHESKFSGTVILKGSKDGPFPTMKRGNTLAWRLMEAVLKAAIPVFKDTARRETGTARCTGFSGLMSLRGRETTAASCSSLFFFSALERLRPANQTAVAATAKRKEEINTHALIHEV